MGRFTRLLPRPRPRADPVVEFEQSSADATVAFDVTRDPPSDNESPAPRRPHPATSYRDRARLRRRLRYLRRARELSFRDLGGFVFDAHRFDRPRNDIVAAKLKGLAGMDAELRSLEDALDDHRELTLLHEPGISVCPRCATLQASDANFCSGCGLPSRGAALPLGPRAPLPLADLPSSAATGQQSTTVLSQQAARIDLRKPPAKPDAPAPASPPK